MPNGFARSWQREPLQAQTKVSGMRLDRTRVAIPPGVVVFLGITAVVRLYAWPRVAGTSFEIADYASNSILIQKAKSLQLLNGNYSRVGFYHPGPAMLYVLMLGEVVFHDWLHLTTPVGGQMLALVALNAAWLTLIFLLLSRLFGGRLNGAFATLLFAAAMARLSHEAFTGLWPPHIYVFPFAALVVAIAMSASGNARFLPIVALCSGFLFNGHVSFAATISTMIVFALLANGIAVWSGWLPAERSWWTLAFWKQNRRPIFAALSLGFLFLLPLILDSIIHYPGQIPRYMAFSRENPGQKLSGALIFVASYIGSPIFACSATLGLFALVAGLKTESDTREPATLMLVALAAATAGVLFYAKFGVDDLSQTYVALYYYSIPAFAVAVAALCLAAPLRKPLKGMLIAAAVAPAVLVLDAGLRKPLDAYGDQLNTAYIPDLYSKLTSLGPELALDLDQSIDWGFVWTNVVGLEAFASRRDEHPFCVGKNWHVLFHKEFRCTTEQLATYRHLLVTKASPVAFEPNTVLESNGLAFLTTTPPLLQLGRNLSIENNRFAFGTFILDSGWSSPEGEFVWSVGREAVLRFRAPVTARHLTLALSAFTPGNRLLTGRIEVDGVAARDFRFNKGEERQALVVDLPQTDREERRVLVKIDNPASPRELGLSTDSRMLGVALHAIRVD